MIDSHYNKIHQGVAPPPMVSDEEGDIVYRRSCGGFLDVDRHVSEFDNAKGGCFLLHGDVLMEV